MAAALSGFWAASGTAVPTEFVGNPGFETNTSGWNTSSSGANIALTRVAGGHSGGWAAKLANTGTTVSTYAVLQDSPNWVATTAAGSYTGSMWVRADTAGALFKLKFKEYSGSTTVGTAVTQVTLTTAWQLVTVAYSVATAGTTLDFQAYVSNAAPGTAFYADDASILLGSTGGALDHVVVRPASVSVVAGGAQVFTAEGFDASNVSLGDVTASTVFSIAPDGSCLANSCSASVVGAHTVTGTSGGKSGTASLAVTAGGLDHLVLAPASASIGAGGSQAYTAQGRDLYDNSLGDLTAGTVFSIAPNGSCAGGSCSASVAGAHTVTGTSSGKTGTATLQVTADYVLNPGFEVNTSGWNTSSSGSGVVLARVAGGHSGGWAAKLSNTSSRSRTSVLQDSTNWVATTAAATYTGRMWVRSDTAGAVLRLQLQEFSGSTLRGTGFTNVTLSTSWQLVTVTYTVVAPGSTLDFRAYVSNAAPGTAFYADDASIVSSPPPPPTITSFAPSSGGVGSSVVITGTNLTGATAVRFNGTAATAFTVDSPTQITATVPVGATSGAIVVTTPGGQTTNATVFTVLPLPTITSFVPSSGGVGSSVVITGTNLTGATAVRFNGTAATAFTVDSPTQITATVPVGATSGAIVVTTPGGQTTNATVFTVTSAGAAFAVYVGYYDTHHPDFLQPKPNPWQGSPGVVFIGTPDSSSGGWDASAVRIDNLSGAPLTNVVVTVDIGSHHLTLWGTNTIPTGQSLILTQTAFANFDGSDYNSAGCFGCDPALCTSAASSTIPVVHITVNGAPTTDISDPLQVLNTRGVDSAGCPDTGSVSSRRDESHDWQQQWPPPPLPTVTGFAPSLGGVGSSVVITGTNLTGAGVVKFGAARTNATSFTVNSPTQITATVPMGASGTGPIVVTTPGGTATSAAQFTVTV